MNNSHIMWNFDSFDLQYNRIIRKKQVQKQAFYIGVWQNKCGKNKFVKQKPLTGMMESCMIAKVITDGEICRADIFI